MQWYIETLIKIFSRPKEFFTNMPEGSWKEGALSFLLITGWIISLTLTFVVFINSYFPTGLSLIEGIYGRKLAIVLPVLMVMGAVFFIMTAFIVGGLFICAMIGLLGVSAGILNFLLMLLGGTSNIYETLKASFYSSFALLASLLNILLMIAVKYHLMSFGSWITWERIVYYLMCLYMFYLFAVMGMNTHKVSGWKACLAAAIPFVVLVLINIVFSAKILPKFAGMLG